ncbi:MAG: type II toxin-antitoxin system VapC family toxin [Solirubrobacterales bacterium]
MKLYLDSSALVKRYVAEEGSDEVVRAMDEADAWSSCRLAFVETVRAVGLRAGSRGAGRIKSDWRNVDVVELDRGLAERAAKVALSTGLRALDAVHLAAALSVPGERPLFATWDIHLHRAARKHGLQTLPAALG